MSRIRTIKPEMLTDETVAELSDAGFRLFVACIVLADDYGNLRADARHLRGQAWWAHDTTIAQVEAAVAEVTRPRPDGSPGLVTLYQVRGQTYAHIEGWSRHQRIHNPGAARVPAPPATQETSTNPRPSEPLGNPPRNSEDVGAPRKASELLALDLDQDPDLERDLRAQAREQAPPESLGNPSRDSETLASPGGAKREGDLEIAVSQPETAPTNAGEPGGESTPDEAPPTPTRAEAMQIRKVEWARAYARGMSAAQGEDFAVPGDSRDLDALATLTSRAKDAAGKPLRGPALDAWFESIAGLFYRSRMGEGRFYSGFAPRGCRKWLEEGPARDRFPPGSPKTGGGGGFKPQPAEVGDGWENAPWARGRS